jgi:RNA polymerase sigma factor (sigma-70 family)
MDAQARAVGAQYLADNLPLVNAIVTAVARRKRLSATETEEFRSAAYLKLVADDYAVLRAFTHRCTLRTYLTVVLQRAFLDYRTREWGKWRPSAQSRRTGKAGIRLEQLVVRDGVPLEHAVDIVSLESTVQRSVLLALARSFVPRISRQHVAAEIGERMLDPTLAPDQRVHRQELREAAARVSSALGRCLGALPADDRRLLRSRYWGGRTLADIARSTRVPQRKLYTRVERLMAQLRASITASGCADMARALMAEDTWRDMLM